ncbi:dispanin subfamily A member 2b-like [Emydura macquarii macquarii]|uniref:dispanin subfamily A member 2b-like n=1 Tax=Emydura macquarii macquarii TaxID=1129001 RepID=UPI00352A227A
MECKAQTVCINLQPQGPAPPYPGPPQGFPADQPADFVLWSLFNVLLCQKIACLGCLGFPALIFSIKARDRKVLGDLKSARRYGTTAKVLNIIGSLLVIIAIVTILVFLSLGDLSSVF